MKKSSVVSATLPTGQSWTASIEAHMTVWSLWRRLVALAIDDGDIGVAVDVADDGDVVLRTVYAAQWTGVELVVAPDGQVSNCSEQSAPGLPEDRRPAPSHLQSLL